MFLRELPFVCTNEVAVVDDFLSADEEAIDPMWACEDEPRDQIVGATELQAVGSPDGDVRPFTDGQLANVGTAKHGGAPACPEPERLAGAERLRTAARAGDEQCLLDLEEEVAALVRGRAVDAEPDPDVRVDQIAHARDARAEPHVRRRTVRDPDVVRAELRNVIVRQVHAVRAPDVSREPAQLFGVLDGPAAVEPRQ